MNDKFSKITKWHPILFYSTLVGMLCLFGYVLTSLSKGKSAIKTMLFINSLIINDISLR